MSEPREYIASPADTAAVAPPLLPPGTRPRSHGFRVVKYAEFSVEDPMANSSRLPFPTITAPDSCNLSATWALYGGTKFSSIFEQHVVRMPLVHRLSLSIIGTPSSGPSLPGPRLSSDARASAIASSPVTVTNALTLSSTLSMRSRTAFVNSAEEISPRASRSDAS